MKFLHNILLVFLLLQLFSGCDDKNKTESNLKNENKVSSESITKNSPWFCKDENLKGLNFEIVRDHAKKRMQNPLNKKKEILPMADFSCISKVKGQTRNPPRAGLVIDIPDNIIAKFNNLSIENVFTGIVKKGNGILYIQNLTISNFGEDALNIQGSNVYINTLNTFDSKPVRPYDYIKTTHKNNAKFIQNILKKGQEILSEEEIKNNLNWKPSKIKKNGRMVQETIKVDGKELKLWITKEFSHADAGFQAYFQKPNRDKKSETPALDKTTFVSFDEMDSVASDLYERYKEIDQSLKYFDVQKEVMKRINSLRKKDDTQDQSPRKDGFKIDSPENGIINFDSSNQYYIKVIKEKGVLELNERTQEIAPKECGNHKLCSCSTDQRFNGTVNKITIKNIKIKTDLPTVQAIILSEGSHYEDFNLGETSIDITSAYPFWFVGNTLRKSTIGNVNAKLVCDKSRYKVRQKTCGIVYVEEGRNEKAYICYDLPDVSCDDYPKVKIGTGLVNEAPCIKEAYKPNKSKTSGVTLNGVACKKALEYAIPHGRVSLTNERQPNGKDEISKTCP